MIKLSMYDGNISTCNA